MKETLVVKNSITIDAPANKVWEVLIAPKYIRQWDSLPQDFPDYYLEAGREVIWTGNSRRIVTELVPNEYLKMSLYMEKWDLPPSAYSIGYTYALTRQEDQTLLHLEIGDFATVLNGADYYESFSDFADKALEKVKRIAENKV